MKVLSIITLCQNDETVIEKTMQSVISQKTDEVEFVIVDGNSTDATQDHIVNQGALVDRFVKSDQGIANAMNEGIKAAKGKWIGFLHAGDWLEPKCIDLILDELRNKEEGVWCGVQRFIPKVGSAYMSIPRPQRLMNEMSVNHIGAFVHRSVYHEYGTYDPQYNYAMDYDCFHRFAISNTPFYTSKVLVANMRGGGVSDTHWIQALIEVWRIRRSKQGIASIAGLLASLCRMGTKRVLLKIGLSSIVMSYRRIYGKS